MSSGFFADTHVIPLEAAAQRRAVQTRQEFGLPPGDDLLPFVPRGLAHPAAWSPSGWLEMMLPPFEKVADGKERTVKSGPW